MQEEKKDETLVSDVSSVPIKGYIVLFFAICIFSGAFGNIEGWWSWLKIFDFDTLNGQFGKIKELNKQTFAGTGGFGARDGFLFGFGLLPGVMLALGVIEVVERYGGLKAAQKLMTPVLRPILGIPGVTGLALVSSLQSTDAGAGMTKALYEEKLINDKERLIFAAFQFTAGGTITNYLSTGSALFSFLTVPIMWPLIILFIMKIVGANIMRGFLFVTSRREAGNE